ncbi:sulfatase [Thalassotalea sp. SU-HH00458]|uniref:sulfatase n=1 Tax=Thalassotalea sp. SU-HH00458 TaxID=3127657 RepID=UPI00310A8E69
MMYHLGFTKNNSLLLRRILLILLLLSFSSLANESSKNVLLITIDDLNAWVGNLNVHPLAKTPNIDKLAKRGVSFTNAHTAVPVCAASRAALMSGVLPHKSGFYTNGDHQVNAHSVVKNRPHLTELFREKGYKTYGAGKIYHRWVTDDSDAFDDKTYDSYLPLDTVLPTDDMLVNGDGYKGYKFYPFPDNGTRIKRELNINKGTSLTAGVVSRDKLPNGKMPDELIAEWGINQLTQYAKNKPNKYAKQQPFYMALGFLRPHLPFAVPKKYFDMFPLSKIDLPKVDDMSDIPLYGKAMTMGSIPSGDHGAVLSLKGNWKELIQGYLASIAFIDEQVGRVLESLKLAGLDDNTIVILTSDHGQNLGEKTNWRKMSLWEEATRIPLIISTPNNKNNGHKVSAAVSLIDIYPTLVSLTNLPPQERYDGQDLTPLLIDPLKEWDHPVLISWRYKNFAVRSNQYRYIRYRDGSEELYNHREDPLEQINVVKYEENKEVVAKLKAYIPVKVALPYNKKEWQGDVLEKHIGNWQENGEPFWFELNKN